MLNLLLGDVEKYSKNGNTIYIVLDNFSSNKSIFVKDISDVSNMKLIFLTPYSPDSSPIEQVLRTCKNRLGYILFNNKKHLEKEFAKTFFEAINEGNFMDKWIKTLI